jgi:hypothetical protein
MRLGSSIASFDQVNDEMVVALLSSAAEPSVSISFPSGDQRIYASIA